MDLYDFSARGFAFSKSVSRWRAAVVRRFTRPDSDDLIASLNEVASAVASSLSVDDVLLTIVDRAKRITDTDKAVLLLTQNQSSELDFDTLVARGVRADHPQETWQGELQPIALRAFRAGEAIVEEDRELDRCLLASPIKITDRPIGLLLVINSLERGFSAQQLRFLAILSAFAASAIENATLAEDHRHVMLAGERDRIAREMHDGVMQSLFSVSLGLELCKKLVYRDATVTARRLMELQEQLNTSMTELRRFIYDLRPIKLQELGLAGAIEHWIDDATSGRTIRGRLNIRGETRPLTPGAEACLYRVAKEAISNAVRHSGASAFEVTITFTPDKVAVAIVDDGAGFRVEESLERGSGIGLHSMRERMERAGGFLRFESHPGSGTRVEAELY